MNYLGCPNLHVHASVSWKSWEMNNDRKKKIVLGILLVIGLLNVGFMFTTWFASNVCFFKSCSEAGSLKLMFKVGCCPVP